jgi:hypothetical protein
MHDQQARGSISPPPHPSRRPLPFHAGSCACVPGRGRVRAAPIGCLTPAVISRESPVMQATTIRGFLREIVSSWFTGMSGPLSVPLAIASVFVPSDTAKVLLGLTAFACFFGAAYGVWRRERMARNASDVRTAALEDRLSPKIGISINANGIADERDRSGTLVAKRVQVIVKSLTDAPLVGCQAEIERVERLDSRGSILLDDPLRVEWGNVDEGDKFGKITIPAGAQRRVNLFFISCVQGAPLVPVIPALKQEFMEGVSRPGKYKVCVLVSSISATPARQQFILDWYDYENITLLSVSETARDTTSLSPPPLRPD